MYLDVAEKVETHVCVHTYTCLYMSTYIYDVYIYTYLYIYIHTYIYLYTHPCKRIFSGEHKRDDLKRKPIRYFCVVFQKDVTASESFFMTFQELGVGKTQAS